MAQGGDVVPDSGPGGHRGAGEFNPENWFLARFDGEPIGIMLLTCLDAEGIWELAYLGLAPAWRGRGLGRALVHQATAQAIARGAEMLLVAADRRNLPALGLYRSAGFVDTGEQDVLLHLAPKS
ncbi:MAG TPA: GNAT family N-acetyltransferase [Phenylobacterium sp.]|nr:GNAT family N-acetyltransferase [Phenylobacterium sp.]